MTTPYPHALADALALVTNLDSSDNAAAAMTAHLTEDELVEMVCHLATLVLLAREVGTDLTLTEWTTAVLANADTPT